MPQSGFVLRKRLKLSDYATPNVPCGSSIQRAIDEAWREGRELEIDSLKSGKSWITNRTLKAPAGWVDGSTNANYHGVRGRIRGEWWGEHNYNDDFAQSLSLWSAGGLSGSIIKAGPAFTFGDTLFEIGPANWGTVIDGVGFLGNGRAGVLVHNGSGRVTLKNIGAGDLNLDGTENPRGLGNWCILGAPITTTGASARVIGAGFNGEGFLHSHYENLRLMPSTNDSQLNIDGMGGGLALSNSGGYFPTDCVIRHLYVATLRNKGGTNATGVGCLLRGCGGTTLSEYHVTTTENAADTDSNYVGLLLDADNMRCTDIYLDSQPMTNNHGEGSAYLLFSAGACRNVVSAVTVIYPNGWSANMLAASIGVIGVGGDGYGNQVRGMVIVNDDCMAASAVPDHLVRLLSAPGSTASVGQDFNFLLDGVTGEGLTHDSSSYAPTFGIHNNVGTFSTFGDGSDGESQWTGANGTARLRWRNVIGSAS